MSQANQKAIIKQALDLININNLVDAHTILLKADRLFPYNIEIYHLLSVVHGMSGEYNQSETYCKKALAINHNAVIIYNNLGTAQKLQGKFDDAEKSFLAAINIKKDYIDAYVNLANLFIETEKINDAESLLNTAMDIDSSNTSLNLACGNLRLKQDNHKEAIKIYENILRSQPGTTDAIINLGQIHEHLGNMDIALQYYRAALDIIPGYEQSIIGIASILEKQGQFKEALKVIKTCIANSRNMKLHIICGRIYSRMQDYSKSEEVLLKAKDIVSVAQHKQELLYELGDLHDKLALYDEAFEYYYQANQINRLYFDRNETINFFSAIKSTYTSKSLKMLATSNHPSIQPIFIVGMPRSGTSLVEQILSSHSQICGAGELEYIDDIIYDLQSTNNRLQYPYLIKNIQPTDLLHHAKKYIDSIEQFSSDATYITNKMPHNFLHLGFIQQLFPYAKIIHCTRNPKDTALSIYFHQFNTNHPYASNLSDLHFYYQQYKDLMMHWDNELSLQMITIKYEDLIHNLELACRQLIDFCHLEWESNCLNFHNNIRTVNTPSYHQVRQPLYKNAIDRHLNYSQHLIDFQ